MKKKWTKEKIDKVRSMVNAKVPLEEVSIHFDTTPCALKSLCSLNKIKLKYKFKYTHIYEKVLNYYIINGKDAAKKKFNLDEKSFNNCYETAIKKFPQRRDTRRKDPWSLKDLLFMLRKSGFISREAINNKIKRGKNYRVVKEKLKLLKISSSRTVNGLTLKTAVNYFGDLDFSPIKTKACPEGFEMILVTWSDLYKNIKYKRKIDPNIKKCVKTMALFQKFIHGRYV
jgi:hypothetical protein